MRIHVWSAAVAVVVLLAGCGAPKPQLPDSKKESKPDTSNIQIHGDASDPGNKLVMAAIADLQTFWAKEDPDRYGGEFEPVEGGFFAAVPSNGDVPPCASDPQEVAARAAFYCPSKDVVA